jgi:hypothetical protein
VVVVVAGDEDTTFYTLESSDLKTWSLREVSDLIGKSSAS